MMVPMPSGERDGTHAARIWKLIAHHEDRAAAIRWQLANGRIAVGWGNTGDLRDARFRDSSAIAAAIKTAYTGIKNLGTGRPSLWNFVHEMREGDLAIIVGVGGRRSHVVEVVGPYVWVPERDSPCDYMHQRAAVPTDHDPEKLWALVGRRIAVGQSPHLTVARCDLVEAESNPAAPAYVEGYRVETLVSSLERDPRAREACLGHYGHACVVCNMEFSKQYGPEFMSGIHVHHLKPLADADAPREIDPVADLRPLCPNCHAAAHQRRPPYTPEELRGLLSAHGDA